MDKTGFLKELKQYLAVLNEGEQKDILDEYAQHIDMKMERGMSESEAIKDFGDIQELAAEILEAYHVNPQFGVKRHVRFPSMKEEMPVVDLAKKGRNFWSKGRTLLKKLCVGAGLGLLRIWHVVTKPFSRMKEAWSNRKLTEYKQPKWRWGARTEAPSAVGTERIRRTKMFGGILGMAASGIRNLFGFIIGLAVWCIRWAWNGFMLFFALMTGMMTLVCLFGLGTLAVLLMQGYPLTGVTIGCLGLVLCGGSLTVAAFCLCRFRARHRLAVHTGTGDADIAERAKEGQQYVELDVQEVTEHA